MAGKTEDFSNLDRPGRVAAVLSLHSRALVYTVLGMAVLLAWAILLAMATRAADIRGWSADTPGDALLRWLPAVPLPDFLDGFFSLCLSPAGLEAGRPGLFGVLVVMWFLMAIATMLPSAAPMIRTYCEIADTARAKGEHVVHPLVLVMGYLAAWLAASAGFAALTLLVQASGGSGRPLDPLAGFAGAGALFIAGIYQFSGLKQACLKKCRNPFAVLFSRWSARPGRVFRLGVEQGLWCLGCCWGLMLVMFAVGVMNLFWMALIGLFAMVEKGGGGRFAGWLAGTILLVWSAALLLVSL